ncbi:Hsp70 family protein [Streptomyces kutzneri]|uniref:Hsp70 family protein n=1 Tax=Streptomyces kutzneri TaxID=3051179 RepID=UPI0028D8869E|nr:Hsp70 family protein [Streptomyces sp. DSM 40907]
MIAIDLGHRFGRVARVGPDGRLEVTLTELAGVDGVLDPVRALPRLLGSSRSDEDPLAVEPDRTVLLGLPVSGGREDELRYAVERAGLDVARVVPEPVAVALHYGAVAEGVDHTVLVCDLGATTLDLSVLAIAPDLTVHVVRALSLRLGGEVWDAAVAAELTGGLPEGADPLRAARTLREGLDGSDVATGSVEDAAGEQHPLTLERASFERAVAPLRDGVLAAVAEQLTTAEPAVDTVLLAGGMGAAPGLRAGIEALPAARGLVVRCDRPALAVVLGLLSLRDFGVLRVVTGSPAPPVRGGTGYARPGSGHPRARAGYLGPDDACAESDPERATVATDPEPRTGRPPAQDPEPGSRQGGAPAVQDAGPMPDQAERAGPEEAEEPDEPGGRRGAFEPPEPDEATQPYADPPDTGAPHAPYAGPPPAEPPYPDPPEAGPAPTAAPTEAAEPPPPGPGAADPPGHDSPYDVTAGSSTGSASEPRVLFAVPVDQLQVIRRGDHLLVLWAWPEGALSARVRWRREGGTAGAGDGDAVCRRRMYEHDGGFDLAVGRGAVTLTVEALVPELHEGCEGASSLLVTAAPAVVAYEPIVRRRLKGRVASVTFTSDTGCDLPGIRIVHGLGRFRPTTTAEGTVLHEVPAQRLSAGTPMTVEFPLPATRGPSWLVCFPADAGTDSGIDIRPTALHRLRVT